LHSFAKKILMRKIYLLAFCFISVSTFAQDRYFARTYTSNVLPKNGIDIEFWHTSRFGHSGQFFHAQDQRVELEMGLGKNLQTAFYFNRYQKRFSENDSETVTSNEIGFSNEWKLRLSNPMTNKIGSAIYAEWGIKGGDEAELEAKIILDKKIRKSVFAFNAAIEYEREFEWKGLGFEIRNFNKIAKTGGWQNSVFYGGPTFNYWGDGWFVIANYQPQWGNVKKTVYDPFSKVLDDQERAQARIIVGISIK
jgi:hypothetical protein